ncbi:MAG: transposase [Spirochaetales bacterium]|nr:transposase [Spirochaetales bacterium]
MRNLDFETLRRPASPDYGGNRGSAAHGDIEKNGYFYHVITRSWRRETVFYPDIAKYRHDLLCKLCAGQGVTILFSVTMPNHTHDVLMGPSWDVISEIVRIMNTHVSRFIRTKYPEKKKVFSKCPIYVIVKDLSVLFFLGKYIYDNPAVLAEYDRKAPHSCFKAFESGKLQEPAYDRKIYQKLFGMSPQEILEVYRTMTKDGVSLFARTRFSEWTPEQNKKLFINSSYGKL